MPAGNAVGGSQIKVAKTNKAAGSGRSIKLGRDLRISTASATFRSLRDAAVGPEPKILLDARQVEKADAAGLQALVAGRRALEQAGKRVEWSGATEQLKAAAALLGLEDALGLAP